MRLARPSCETAHLLGRGRQALCLCRPGPGTSDPFNDDQEEHSIEHGRNPFGTMLAGSISQPCPAAAA